MIVCLDDRHNRGVKESTLQTFDVVSLYESLLISQGNCNLKHRSNFDRIFFFLRQISYIAPAGLGFPVWLRVAVSPSSSLPSLESWDLRACTAVPGFKVFSSFF